MSATLVSNNPNQISGASNLNVSGNPTGSSDQVTVKSKEYYVKVPKTKKRFHALKFHTTNVDLASWSKAEMHRDTTNMPITQKQDWETLPKSGQGSEFGREAKELAKRRRFTTFASKKTSIEDMPWIISSQGNEKDNKKERQYLGKKSVSENSSYFVFIKCADGGFEAHPLEDWYSFAPHRTYKTLNIEEAEEEFKRRHKILNKCLIMANKRKAQEAEFDDGDEEESGKKSVNKALYGGSVAKSSGSGARGSDDDDDRKSKSKKSTKSSTLSESEDDGKSDEDEYATRAKNKPKTRQKNKRRSEYNSDEEFRNKEDSDDGDHEGLEKDYSSSGTESESEPETSKYEEKYQEKGIDEEEAIKVMDKSDDEESEDEDLTEEGKEYRKLISKKDQEEENESDDAEDIFKNDDSKDSSSTLDDLDLDDDKPKKLKQTTSSSDTANKLKRKATENLDKSKTKQSKKQQAKASTSGSATASSTLAQDESSSSSSISNINQSKSAKTAAILAAAAANQQQQQSSSQNTTKQPTQASSGSGITEEEVRRYLSRKPMTTTELFQKFRSKTKDTMTKDEILQALKVILNKLKCKIIQQNNSNYLSLP